MSLASTLFEVAMSAIKVERWRAAAENAELRAEVRRLEQRVRQLEKLYTAQVVEQRAYDHFLENTDGGTDNVH